MEFFRIYGSFWKSWSSDIKDNRMFKLVFTFPVAAKEPKVALPERFDGDREKISRIY